MARKNTKRLYLDVHVLQNLPPSCVNRDDTGSPKTAVYGGVTRARVSSQSWKRAMRLMFKDLVADEKLGVRTKYIVSVVADEIRRLGFEGDADKAAVQILQTAEVSLKAGKGEQAEGMARDALFFLSMAQAKALATLAVEKPETVSTKPAKEAKQEAQQVLRNYPAIDVSLFGRMVAEAPSLNTDACAQVAHSISTHKVSNEYDYFTAVDDCAPEDNAGAGHIGTVEFNSATLYRYGTVAVHELAEQLAQDTVEAVRSFVQAFICSMPTGKQSTFANRTLPAAVMVTLRTDQPINLVGAFENPVKAGDGGYMMASVGRLVEHAHTVYENFANEPVVSLVIGDFPENAGETVSLNDLLIRLSEEMKRYMSSDGESQ